MPLPGEGVEDGLHFGESGGVAGDVAVEAGDLQLVVSVGFSPLGYHGAPLDERLQRLVALERFLCFFDFRCHCALLLLYSGHAAVHPGEVGAERLRFALNFSLFRSILG